MTKYNYKISIEKIIENYIKINSKKLKCIKITISKKIPTNYYLKMTHAEIFNVAKKSFSKINKNIFFNNGIKIYVSNRDIKESIAKTIRSINQREILNKHIIVFENLDKIIENGVIISSNKEMKKRKQFLYWDYYITVVNILNKKYIVEFDTVIRNNNEKHFRLERIYQIEKTGIRPRRLKNQ